MINALHLIWILPVAFMMGFLWAALIRNGKTTDTTTTQHDE